MGDDVYEDQRFSSTERRQGDLNNFKFMNSHININEIKDIYESV